jgi:ATP-dependent Lon protease
LSQVSYVATANSVETLPSPLRDRFRTIIFPKPTAVDLDALMPAILADVVRESGLDPRWAVPLTGYERDFVATVWQGGSVRKLRRTVEAVIHARDGQRCLN